MKCLLTLLAIGLGWTMAMAQPDNDLIENAIDIGYGPVPYTEDAVDFPNATNTNDSTPALGCALSQSGVWYKFKATKTSAIGAGILLPDSPVIIFFEGPAEDVTSGMELEYVDQLDNPCNEGAISGIETTPGTTYYIYMKNNVASDIFINSTDIFETPENDLIENAIDLNGMEDYSEEDIHFLMATSTDDGGASGCDIGEAGIWYKFTAQGDGEVIAGISGPVDQSGIIFYSADNENATSGSDLTWVNSPDNPCGPGNLRSIEASQGTSYYVFTGTYDAYADFSINLSGILSANSFNTFSFSYYPNPVNNMLHIDSKNTLTNIRIFNLTGQEVLCQKILDTQASVSLRALTSGMYLATISNGEQTSTFKLIKK